MSETDRKPLPPYLPYRTFGTFLDHLKAIGVPSHIDKSVMTQFSGAMQSWLRSALRYMKLVDSEDVPDPRLAKLAKSDGNDRKAQLAELFRASYGFLDGKIDMANTTPAKLRAAVVELGATGDTVDKIVAFMVAMAKDAGLPLSSLLVNRASAPRRPRTKNPTQKAKAGSWDDKDFTDDEDDPQPTGTEMKTTVSLLKAGGTLTLIAKVNVFALVGDERDFVFALIDKMNEFQVKQGGGSD